MAGAPRKQSNALAGHRAAGAAAVQLVPRGEPAPKPPVGMLKATRDEWFEFWDSSVASQVRTLADHGALEDLFYAKDELRRARKLWKREPFVTGSHGQLVLNPIRLKIDKCREYIIKQSDRFGMTPLARARLGWVVAEGASAAVRMKALLDSEFDGEDDD